MTPLRKRLDALEYRIEHGQHEDAQNHLFDLLRGLYLIQLPEDRVTTCGKELRELWEVTKA